MDLGEQITLEGFVEHEPGELLIAKKLIGNHAKGLMLHFPGFERLLLRLEYAGHGSGSRSVTVHGAVTVADKVHEASGHDKNVFFALDNCLKALAR